MEMNKCIETFYKTMVNNEHFLKNAKKLQGIIQFVEGSIEKAVKKGDYSVELNFPDFPEDKKEYIERVMSQLEKEGFFVQSYPQWGLIYVVSWDWTGKLTKSMSDVVYEKMMEVEF